MKEEKVNPDVEPDSKMSSNIETDPNKLSNEIKVSQSTTTASGSDQNFKNKLSNVKKGKRKLPKLNQKPDYEFQSEEDDLNRAKKYKFPISFV